LQTHHTIGNNVFITKRSVLDDIEKWLLDLCEQNESLRTFDETEFRPLIAKFWLDSCGYNSLGFYGTRRWLQSPLSKHSQTKNALPALLVKNVVRFLKRSP
jgi:hypothetical protein